VEKLIIKIMEIKFVVTTRNKDNDKRFQMPGIPNNIDRDKNNPLSFKE
jgi:hypothetical protein